ncbi:uncharacterized protein LOC111061473 [Nilaparvata lugens]|uniref:uncharacterized protein LOC111061473 n=1 Tax=Nilaparvata lugens TaxID=108931 RepID=UPI00193E514B|nr:uncharacterized protein LOC111061473 [Nilaparvata lugens]
MTITTLLSKMVKRPTSGLTSRTQLTGYLLLGLICSGAIAPAMSYPGSDFNPALIHEARQAHAQAIHTSSYEPHQPHPQYHHPAPEARKFAEKPNASKKVQALEDRNDLDDIQTNQIQDAGGFSWSNMLGMVMQLLFSPGSVQQGPTKSDSLDTDTVNNHQLKFKTNKITNGNYCSWLQVKKHCIGRSGILAAVLSAVLGSKDPDQVATMAKQAGEFINIVVNLLDALKTSFSHRSLAARSIGKKDSVSEAAVAGLTLLKGYVRTMKTADDNCMQRYMCEANRECSSQNGSAIYCQLGTYATSFILQRSSSSPFDAFYEAGRRGRSGDDCQQLYLACNEV